MVVDSQTPTWKKACSIDKQPVIQNLKEKLNFNPPVTDKAQLLHTYFECCITFF